MSVALRIRALVGLTLLPLAAAAAQTDHMHLGGRFIYDASDEHAGLGVQFSGPIGHRLELYPSGDYYFVDVGTKWVANIDVKYRFPAADRPMWFYVGSGLAFDSRTVAGANSMKTGVNMFVGLEPLRGSVHPFAELRFTARNQVRGALAAGLNFTLGRAHR